MGIKGSTREAREAQKRKRKVVLSVLGTIAVVVTTLIITLAFIGSSMDDDISFENYPEVHNHLQDDPKVPPSNPERVSPTEVRPVALGTEKPDYTKEIGKVKNTIALASKLEIQAFLDLNPIPLRKVLKGDVLRLMETALSGYKPGFYDINILEQQSIGEVDIHAEGKQLFAEVELFETWSGHTHRTYDDYCLTHRLTQNMPQTVFLEKESSTWYITSIIHHNNSPLLPTTCGHYNCALL